MNDKCEYCDGIGTFGPLLTWDMLMKIHRGHWSFLFLHKKYIRFSNNKEMYKERCPKCLGDGYLDWIERIVGKRIENVKKVIQ